ncbi:MAG: helix-turn-helix domain-containing protein [Clostridia bacterium]|nr:helix-turn-helix domain-containing protein [Clostridia bacterium]
MFSFRYNDMEISHQLAQSPAEAKDGESEPHCHERCVEVYACMGGTVKVIVESRQKVLEKGDLAVIMPYEMHEIEMTGDAPHEFMDCKLPVTFLGMNIANRLKACGTFYVWPSKIVFLDRMDEFYEQYREEGDSDEMLYLGIAFWMAAILVFLARNDAPAEATGSESWLVTEIRQYAADNLDKKITVQDLAERFHRSPSYIAKQFLAATGEPVMTYIRRQKMDIAEHLILNNAKPSDVAKHIGYADYSSFYRAYVSVKGVPPTCGGK